MDFANAIVAFPNTSSAPDAALTLKLNPHGSRKSTSRKLHWLPVDAAGTSEPHVALSNVVLVKYPHPSVS